MRSTATTATAAVLAALALAACSGGSSSAEDDVEQAVRDYMDAMNSGDVDRIRELTSERCRDEQSREETQELVDLVDEVYGDIDLKSIEITDVTDDSAQVNAVSGIDALDDDDSARYVLEDGQWRVDDC